ncbi:response regulator [Pedobacter frigiditerrae]|uniref:Response regulator n=1 Tax=Pedobacter frigiditerrae TaxID=2530452 RepID=A0A4R0MP74_9SPHI|nr:response regulator [Pedobacter frigiditerrae]TCC88032.1 response regulator [Pedobacter frigiditerrae]
MANQTVLIFDDDDDLLTIFSFLFEDMGWQVFTHPTCDDVLERTRETKPDLILMDNWIPTIGGIAATQLLKADEELKAIPVIYISANNDVKALSARAGADAFVAKPFDFDELGALAKKLVNKTGV